MDHIKITADDGVGVISMRKGKVHEINEVMLGEMDKAFRQLEKDDKVRAVVLTGEGKFFSFGLDVPGLLNYTKEDFAAFLTKFTDLYTYMFLFPKPLIAAINGHAIAGGCMIATPCDYRVMADGAKIAINEIKLGAAIFAGAASILRYVCGGRNAETVAFTGEMFSLEKALSLGLIDAVVAPEEVLSKAIEKARQMGAESQPAFGQIKKLLRGPIVEDYIKREKESIREFNEIWYSEKTREILRKVVIKE